MSVWYLESDDEITDAVARLRATEDERVVLVVPPGSRIATGRINFRLLAREAAARKLAFAVVSPDEQVRALAIAGGVVARASVEEAEGALDRGEPAAPPVGTSATPADDGNEPAIGPDAGSDEDTAAPITRTTMAGSSRRRRVAATSVVVVGLAIVGGWAGYRFLPSASIAIEPESLALGPILVSVTASAASDGIDVTRGEIPAQPIAIPLTVEGTFPASGRETSESPAQGSVLFSSAEQSFVQEIAAGTRVTTREGIEFQTTQAVSLRPPSGGPGPAEVQAPVEAVQPGPEGNVDAGSISIVSSLESQGISVSNPEPTDGGDRQETPVITQADYEAATVDLNNRLAGALAVALRDPTIAPEGLTLFAETARLGSVEHRPAPEEARGLISPRVRADRGLDCRRPRGRRVARRGDHRRAARRERARGHGAPA